MVNIFICIDVQRWLADEDWLERLATSQPLRYEGTPLVSSRGAGPFG